MCSQTVLKLPVIDFTNTGLMAGTSGWDVVKGQVKQALEEYGCFEALFDKIPLHLREVILRAAEELLDLPLETKLSNVSNKPFHGYVGQYPHLPLFESMGIDAADILENVEAQTKNFWPGGNQTFSKNVQAFTRQLSELDQTIRRMILESFKLDKYKEEHMDSTKYHLKLMKYKEPKTTETKVGLCNHTDKTMITILYQNQVEGLQVQTKEGEWIDVKPSKHSFIVMMGDVFNAWSNGRLHVPYHRVMMTGDNARYSVGLFSVPKGGYIIKGPEELVDEHHPLLFKLFDFMKFLDFYSTEDGQKAEYPLKAYCGNQN